MRVLRMHRNAFLFSIFSIFPLRIDTPRTFVHSRKRKSVCLERSCSALFTFVVGPENSNVFSNTIFLSWIRSERASILLCSSLLSLRSFAFYEPVFTVLIDDVHTRKSIEIGYFRKDDNNVANVAIIRRSNRTRCDDDN